MNPLDPKSKFPLEMHGHTFMCRYLTGAELLEFDRLTDVANAALQTEGVPAEIKALAVALALPDVRTADGGGDGGDGGGKTPAEVLEPSQMWDLANAIPIRQRLSEIQRKKSASLLPSATAARSATNASGANV